MKRIFSDPTGTPGEGKTVRNLSGTCLDTGTVATITQAGCSSFPITDNNYGSLPTASTIDSEVDNFGFDSNFSILDGGAQEAYPDLWGRLDPGHQATVLVDDCYCVGDGDDRSGLSIGRPRFPNIRTLPFFWVPIRSSGGGVGGEATTLTVVVDVRYSQGTGRFEIDTREITVLKNEEGVVGQLWAQAVVCPEPEE
jgi:hypothetical protein